MKSHGQSWLSVDVRQRYRKDHTVKCPVARHVKYAAEIQAAIDAAVGAGEIIMRYYDEHSAGEYAKTDGSPVTDADIAADAFIREQISTAFPDDGLLTEETADNSDRLQRRRLWIADPIDGTKQFIAHNGRFDVLLALVEDGEPIVAVALQPATGLMHAAARDQGAWRFTDGVWEEFWITDPPYPPRLSGSVYYEGPQRESDLTTIADQLETSELEILDTGFQPRAFDDSQRTYDAFIGFPQPPGTSPANEWDLATSDLFVREAGGMFSDVWGRRYPYNKRNTHVSAGVVVSSTPELHQRLLELLKPIVGDDMPALDPADDLQ